MGYWLGSVEKKQWLFIWYYYFMSKTLTLSSKLALAIILLMFFVVVAAVIVDGLGAISIVIFGGLALVLLSLAFLVSMIIEYTRPHTTYGLNVLIQAVAGIPLAILFIYQFFAFLASSN